MNDPLEEAARKFGGRSKLAAALGISPQAVYKWQQVPPMRVIAVERLTGVSRHRLRPDLYPQDRAA